MKFTEDVVRVALNLGQKEQFVRVDIWEELRDLDVDVDELEIDEVMEQFDRIVEPRLVERHGRFVFVTGHPIEVSPLAHSSNGVSADRFELYVDGMEVANGYSEQNDWRKQQASMEAMGNVDVDYIEDMKIGLPRTCGVGFGVDRLAMLRQGLTDIKDVIAFPAS